MTWSGSIVKRSKGGLLSNCTGEIASYALNNSQPPNILFVTPGTAVYEGMVVGKHASDNDPSFNSCCKMKLNKLCASGKDGIAQLGRLRETLLKRSLD